MKRFFSLLLLLLSSVGADAATFVALNDSLPITFTVYDPDTGSLANADAPIDYTVFENGASMGVTGTISTNFNSTVGLYNLTLTPTTGAGYENGKFYTVEFDYEVGGEPRTLVTGFRVDAATAAVSVATADKNVLVDLFADEPLAGHLTIGTIGAQITANGNQTTANSIRTAMGLATDNLTDLIDGLPTAAENADGLLAKTLLVSPTADTYGEFFANMNERIDVPVSDAVQAAEETAFQDIPVNQVVVPVTRTWVLTSKGTALVGDIPLKCYIDDPKLWAIDFRVDLPTNGTLVDFLDVDVISALDSDGEEIVDGIEFDVDGADTFGVDRNYAKLQITTAAAGTYIIEVKVRYAPAVGGGTAKARVTLIVAE